MYMSSKPQNTVPTKIKDFTVNQKGIEYCKYYFFPLSEPLKVCNQQSHFFIVFFLIIIFENKLYLLLYRHGKFV